MNTILTPGFCLRCAQITCVCLTLHVNYGGHSLKHISKVNSMSKQAVKKFEELEKMIEREFQRWCTSSKKAQTIKNIQVVQNKLSVISYASTDPYKFMSMLYASNIEVKEVMECFRGKDGKSVIKKKLKACRLFEQVLAQSLLFVQTAEFLKSGKTPAPPDEMIRTLQQRVKNVQGWSEILLQMKDDNDEEGEGENLKDE